MPASLSPCMTSSAPTLWSAILLMASSTGSSGATEYKARGLKASNWATVVMMTPPLPESLLRRLAGETYQFMRPIAGAFCESGAARVPLEMHEQDRHGRRCHARHACRLTQGRRPDFPEPLASFIRQARELLVVQICWHRRGLLAACALDLVALAL